MSSRPGVFIFSLGLTTLLVILSCVIIAPGLVMPSSVETNDSTDVSDTKTETRTIFPMDEPEKIPVNAKSSGASQKTPPTHQDPAGSITERHYYFTLDGKTESIALDFPESVHNDYRAKPAPSAKEGNGSFFLAYVNDPEQQKYVAILADEIRAETDSKDDQARIAVNLVQHLRYHRGNVDRYPLEVLYEDEGICGEKSILLALLLRDLGFGSALFYFVPENHMAAGIKVAAPYDYKNSQYAFIESTEPRMITYDGSALRSGQLRSNPEVIVVGTGQQLSSVVADARDAHELANLIACKNNLTLDQIREYEYLDTKYDLSLYSCDNCTAHSIVPTQLKVHQ